MRESVLQEIYVMKFEYTDGYNSDFILLCHELDEFLNQVAGGEENRIEYIRYNKLDDTYEAIVVYDKDIPAGCASFKKYNDECAEIKRVFIRKEYRGRGISNKLMELIETNAKNKGYCCIVLESGEPLAAAMALYRKRGYEIIPNYGQYKNMSDSICMKKEL